MWENPLQRINSKINYYCLEHQCNMEFLTVSERDRYDDGKVPKEGHRRGCCV